MPQSAAKVERKVETGHQAVPAQQAALSMGEVHAIVKPFFQHRPGVYWFDFLTSYSVGLIAYVAVLFLGFLTWGQVAAYVVSVIAFYRSALFIHEISHFRKHSMQKFTIAWNVLFGIPFMMPSFTYTTHLDHHSRKHFATHHDGEYLPLAVQNPWHLFFYFCQPLFMPILTVLRFMVLAPLSWVSSAVARFTYSRASSMVIDLKYVRRLPSGRELRWIRVQEAACCVICWAVAGWILSVNRFPLTYANIVQIYLTAVGILFLNHFRTLGAHRFTNSERREMNFTEQILDSVNYPQHPILAELAMPVGLRYHALHHLCPGIPYHNLGKAHRQLMSELPQDSLYRQTVSSSLLKSIWQVVCGAWKHRKANTYSAAHFQ